MTKHQIKVVREAYSAAYEAFMGREPLKRNDWLKIEEALTITGNQIRLKMGDE
jgi:hypothetical protein